MGLFRKGKTRIIAKSLRTDFVICSHSGEGETPSYSRINTVSLNGSYNDFQYYRFQCKFYTMAALDDGEDADIIMRTMVKGGLKGVKDLMMQKVNAWKEQSLSIAVIGNSGTGKSSFINSIRDLTGEDDGAAETGETDTTYEPKSYIHPEHAKLEFWDLPGVGTMSFPRETYLERVNFKMYDFFLILSAGRFTENDHWLAEQIKSSGRRFFFIRTKIDESMRGAKQSKPKSFNEKDVLDKIRSDCKTNLEKLGLKDATVFLLSSFEMERWDFQAAKEKLIEDFPDLKKEAILFSLSCSTDKIIAKKKEMLSKRIWKVAVSSAIVGAVPVPGVSTVHDIALITAERSFYGKQFGLDEKSLILVARDLSLSVASLIENIQGIAYLTLNIADTQIASDTAESLLAASVPVFGCLLAAGVSYGATCAILRKLLDETEADAKKLAAFVRKSVKAHAATGIV